MPDLQAGNPACLPGGLQARAGARPGPHRPCSQRESCRCPGPRRRGGHRAPPGAKCRDWNGFPSPLLLVGKSEDGRLTLVREHVDPAAHLFSSTRVAWHCLLESSRKFQSSHQKGAGSVWVKPGQTLEPCSGRAGPRPSDPSGLGQRRPRPAFPGPGGWLACGPAGPLLDPHGNQACCVACGSSCHLHCHHGSHTGTPNSQEQRWGGRLLPTPECLLQAPRDHHPRQALWGLGCCLQKPEPFPTLHESFNKQLVCPPRTAADSGGPGGTWLCQAAGEGQEGGVLFFHENDMCLLWKKRTGEQKEELGRSLATQLAAWLSIPLCSVEPRCGVRGTGSPLRALRQHACNP